MSEASGVALGTSAAGGVRPADARAPRKHSRPDPLPSRLVMGIGALAALSVMGAGMGRLPAGTAGEPAVSTTPEPLSARLAGDVVANRVRVERPVRYVRLKPGERAPRGARVIREKAPAPRIVVRWVSAPGSSAAASRASSTSRTPVARTRQSGG